MVIEMHWVPSGAVDTGSSMVVRSPGASAGTTVMCARLRWLRGATDIMAGGAEMPPLFWITRVTTSEAADWLSDGNTADTTVSAYELQLALQWAVAVASLAPLVAGDCADGRGE